MRNSKNIPSLRLVGAAALVALLGSLVPAPAEDRLQGDPDPGRPSQMGYLAQAAWVDTLPQVPMITPAQSAKARPEVAEGPGLAVEQEPVADGLIDEAEILQSEVALARSLQPVAKDPAPLGNAAGKASWTERYELGPGDTLNFSLHGQAELAKQGVPVAPDWTISYLQAKQVSVRGLTVEELRARMELVLSEFHRNPKVIVTPATLGSKKYTVLGKVRSNDIYKLDRPTTLLEAIAKAKGIVVGIRNSNATELADLRRSFVVRGGAKVEVDIERLYKSGDLTQNIQIEPGDYIYIASNVHNEAYVFGSVVQSGMLPLTGRLTVMGAIAESGGYSKHAWKKRVLLVRGSVGSPEARVIDTREVLRGNEKDVLLEPGDIVYVHQRPWAYAEEILDIAIKAYIQAATAVAIQGEDAVSIGL